MISKIIIESFIQLAKDKDIDRKELADIIKEIFEALIQKKYGNVDNFDVIVNMDKGEIEIYQEKEVVEVVDDPDFGNWSNEFNGFTVMGLTASADIDQNMLFHDATEAGIFLMDSQYQAGNNQMDISDVYFDDVDQVLHVNYSDPEANLPFDHYISHQGEIWEMIPSSHDYESVVEYSYALIDPEDGAYNVVFQFSDGNSDDEINLSFVIGDPSECLPAGDVDENGAVDVLDVVLLVSLILCDECTLDDPCLDVNLDDSVDVLDVVLMVSIILTDS